MKLVEIKCVDCGQIREVKPQDLHQVTRCVKCQKIHRRIRREELRSKKEIEEIQTLRLK